MLANVIYSRNPFNPGKDREVVQVRRRRRIDKLAPNTDQPFICLLNGAPLLRANKGWHKSVKDGDVLAFVILPQGGGGGGSNPLKIALMVGLSFAVPGIGAFISSGLGIGAGTFGATLVNAAVGFIGTALINALIPAPKPPSAQQMVAAAAPSPTYNITAQGNQARLGEPIPDLYGRHLIYPDFAAEPYTEYAGNEQYLYQLFVLGQGEYDIEQVRIEDTDINNFEEVEYEVYGPQQNVNLFPNNVVTSPEVSGQELTAAYSGPFTVNASGTQANALGFDIVCPKGVFYAADNGTLDALSITFRFQARLIDDAGAAIGSWVTLATPTITAATSTALRKSYRYSVAAGRYEVQAVRIDVKNTSSRAGHDINWTSARGYLPGNQNYGDITTLAVRIRATNNLSNQSARRINVIATRKLPIWNGTNWSAPTATRSIAWALANICRADYAGKLPDSRIALAELLALDAIYTSRTDYFDAVFDSKQTIWEGLTLTARAGRAKPYMQGGIVHFVRDEAVALPVALFNMRNIVRGTMKVQYVLPNEETVDAVTVTYFDKDSWQPLTVTAQLPGFTANQPAKLQLFGVTSREQAWREGMNIAAINRYRRQIINFSTEMEGFIPTFADLIAIAHDRPRWGASGELVAYDAGTQTITTSEPLVFTVGNHYFAFKKRDGSFSGPWLATAGANEYEAVLADPLDFTPYTGSAEERTAYSFGPGDAYMKLARVMSVKPRGFHRVDITCVNEDAAVHTADTGTAPPVSSSWNLPSRITRPVVTDIEVTLGGNASVPLVVVTWLTANGANNYYVEYSYDSGNSWQRAADTTSNNARFPAQRGNLRVRVAGVGLAVGAWVEWSGDLFAAPPPDVSTFLVSLQPDGTRQFDMSISTLPPDFAGYQIRFRLGTGWTWDDLYPLHEGVIAASPYETNQLTAGSYTFAVKAVDDSGNPSVNANFIVADLADQRASSTIFAVLPHTQGWPGTKTDCSVEPETNTLSANDATSWSGLTSWDAYTQWVLAPISPIIYEHTVIDLGGLLTFTPVVSVIAEGTVTIEESHSDDGVSYTSFTGISLPFSAQYIKIKVTISGAFPRMSLLDIKLSGKSVTEEINDLTTSGLTGSYRIGTGDIRLPITLNYGLISQAQITLQNVGAGWSWELIDKDTSVGPRIKIYNSSNALADCIVDAFVRGA